MKIDYFVYTYEKLADLSNQVLIERIKIWRNLELEKTDFTQLSDVILPNKDAWTKYRQDLRALTKQGPDPKLWVFPEPPQ